MTFLNFLATEVLAEPAILVGLFALVGLLLQRKAIPDVFTGTVKTIVGMLIFSIGAGAAVGSLDAFQQLFTEGFGVQGVVPLSEGVTGLALQEYGSQIAIIMVYGLVVNLLFAAITPMKYVFLTGQHNLFFAAVLTLVLNSAGLGRTHAILLGGVLLGFFAAFFPWLGRKGIKAITGRHDRLRDLLLARVEDRRRLAQHRVAQAAQGAELLPRLRRRHRADDARLLLRRHARGRADVRPGGRR
jgi:PTS system ascorbate-specific IIC component